MIDADPGRWLDRYLDHLRVERMLADNTLDAYARDLLPFVASLLGLPLLLVAFFGVLWLLKLEREDQDQLRRILTRLR